jgi:hypothetical protein
MESYGTTDGTEKDGICGLAGFKGFIGQGVVVCIYRAL